MNHTGPDEGLFPAFFFGSATTGDTGGMSTTEMTLLTLLSLALPSTSCSYAAGPLAATDAHLCSHSDLGNVSGAACSSLVRVVRRRRYQKIPRSSKTTRTGMMTVRQMSRTFIFPDSPASCEDELERLAVALEPAPGVMVGRPDGSNKVATNVVAGSGPSSVNTDRVSCGLAGDDEVAETLGDAIAVAFCADVTAAGVFCGRDDALAGGEGGGGGDGCGD